MRFSRKTSNIEKKKRKVILNLVLIIFLAALVIMVTACGQSEKVEQSNEVAGAKVTAGKDEQANQDKDLLAFYYHGIVISMNEPAAPILADLGKEMAYFEAESCAFKGLDKTYSYPGFDLLTYPIEDDDYIAGVVFTDDSVTTSDGIYIGMTKDDMIDLLVDEYNMENTGVYELVETSVRLQIIVESDEVIAVEYLAVTD